MKGLTPVVLLSMLGSFAQSIGADVNGIWKGRITFNVPSGQAKVDLTLTLKTAGSTLTGTFSGVRDGEPDSTEILDGKVNGAEISFAIATGAADMPRMNFTGKQEGDTLRLIATARNPNDNTEWTFVDDRLKRQK